MVSHSNEQEAEIIFSRVKLVVDRLVGALLNRLSSKYGVPRPNYKIYLSFRDLYEACNGYLPCYTTETKTIHLFVLDATRYITFNSMF